MAEYVSGKSSWTDLPENAGATGVAEVRRFFDGGGKTRLGPVMEEMRRDMEVHCGVFRLEEDLVILKDKLKKHREAFNDVSVQDKGLAYNLDLVEALELGHMLDVCQCICEGALAREESRGGHYRDDFPKRNDETWMKHTLSFIDQGGDVKLDYKPVRTKPLTVDYIPPAERVY